MSKKPTEAAKLTFTRPSGKSRLTEESKTEISKEEVKRISLDLPVSMAIELKVKAAKESTTVREIIITAINKHLNE